MTTDTTTTEKKATKRASVPPAAAARPSAALDELTGAGARHQVLGLERVEVDPKTLTLDVNTRTELKITARFRALIDEHGVLVPLLCRRDPLGNLLVVDGQRRLVVALELGLGLVPVAMLPPIGDDEARILDQLISNTGREGLTAGEQAQAFTQLAAFGRSATTIAKRTGHTPETVEQALTVASSKAATTALVTHPSLTLDQLAALVEFEDEPDVVAALEAVAEDPGAFRHQVQSERDLRDRRAIKAAAVAELPAGVVVLDEAPNYESGLGYLLEKPGGKKLTPANHTGCPGHAVLVGVAQGWVNGDRVLEARYDYYCTTWKKAGHANKYATPASGATSGPQDDTQKAERRALVANNKAADSAQVVRRAWIHELLLRKDLPKDATSYVAAVLYADPTSTLDHALARELLYGDKTLSDRDLLAEFNRPDRALHYLVALAAAQAEHGWPRDFWHERTRYSAPARTAHLVRLAAWGYTLADVEQLAIDTHTKMA